MAGHQHIAPRGACGTGWGEPEHRKGWWRFRETGCQISDADKQGGLDATLGHPLKNGSVSRTATTWQLSTLQIAPQTAGLYNIVNGGIAHYQGGVGRNLGQSVQLLHKATQGPGIHAA